MSLEEAKRMGAMALFSDKYKDVVRVVKIGSSIELCGGTHIESTDEVKKFAILKVESKGSNLYRLEGCTNEMVPILISEAVSKYVEEIKKLLEKASNILKLAEKENISLDFNVIFDERGLNSYQDIIYNKNQYEYIQTEVRNLEKKYNEEKSKKINYDLDKYLNEKIEINGIDAIVMQTSNMDLNILKDICDKLINTMKKGIVFLANVRDQNVNFVCKCSSDINFSAGLLVKKASIMAGGNGGGSSTFAQGGGTKINNLNEIIEEVKKELKEI